MTAARELLALVAKLTDAQKKAIYPGPGNPEYARGFVVTMNALERMIIVESVSKFSVHGKRGARLTPLGRRVRAHLAKTPPDPA